MATGHPPTQPGGLPRLPSSEKAFRLGAPWSPPPFAPQEGQPEGVPHLAHMDGRDSPVPLRRAGSRKGAAPRAYFLPWER